MGMDLKMACVCSLEVSGSCELSNPVRTTADNNEPLVIEHMMPQIDNNADDRRKTVGEISRGSDTYHISAK
jgi:hypothetical protein